MKLNYIKIKNLVKKFSRIVLLSCIYSSNDEVIEAIKEYLSHLSENRNINYAKRLKWRAISRERHIIFKL